MFLKFNTQSTLTYVYIPMNVWASCVHIHVHVVILCACTYTADISVILHIPKTCVYVQSQIDDSVIKCFLSPKALILVTRKLHVYYLYFIAYHTLSGKGVSHFSPFSAPSCLLLLSVVSLSVNYSQTCTSMLKMESNWASSTICMRIFLLVIWT